MRRDTYILIMEILISCQEELVKNRISGSVGINFSTASKYVDFLANRGLLAITTGGKYKTTEKGNILANTLNNINKELKDL